MQIFPFQCIVPREGFPLAICRGDGIVRIYSLVLLPSYWDFPLNTDCNISVQVPIQLHISCTHTLFLPRFTWKQLLQVWRPSLKFSTSLRPHKCQKWIIHFVAKSNRLHSLVERIKFSHSILFILQYFPVKKGQKGDFSSDLDEY